MADFLEGCNDRGMKISEFTEIFCNRCRNPECTRAGWAQDRFAARVSSQEERLFRPTQVDPRLPKYAQIVAKDFQDMLHKAMTLEIASRKGDWEIPQVPVLGQEPAPEPVILSSSPALMTKPSEPVILKPAQKPLTALPAKANTEVPKDGLMLGGPAPKAAEPAPDPWAIPVKKDNKIPVGGKVVLSGPPKEPEK